jgi:hypothetical protein
MPADVSRAVVTPVRGQIAAPVVVDGTCLDQNLRKNQRGASFSPSIDDRPLSHRRAPARHCISTFEAIVQALELLEGAECDVARALAPFEALVERQLRFASERQARRHVQHKRPKPKAVVPRVLAARRADLVVGYGEANAWPKASALGAAPELVHWAAERPFTGERFEALIAPRAPLAPSFHLQTRVARELVLRGESWQSFTRRWAAFLRPTDLLCTWGHFATGLMRREGVPLPEHLDIRVVARRQLRKTPGEVCECAAALGQEVGPSWVPGRTGARLAGLVMVIRALVSQNDADVHATLASEAPASAPPADISGGCALAGGSAACDGGRAS